MILFNFAGRPIQEQMVDSHKDAVFSAFFDISYLKQLCQTHGNEFGHLMYILPGLQTVRVHGRVIRIVQVEPPQPAKANGDPIKEDDPDLQRQKIGVVGRLEDNLSDATGKLHTFLLASPSIRQLKNDFRGGEATFKSVEDAKLTKWYLMLDVTDAKRPTYKSPNEK